MIIRYEATTSETSHQAISAPWPGTAVHGVRKSTRGSQPIGGKPCHANSSFNFRRVQLHRPRARHLLKQDRTASRKRASDRSSCIGVPPAARAGRLASLPRRNFAARSANLPLRQRIDTMPTAHARQPMPFGYLVASQPQLLGPGRGQPAGAPSKQPRCDRCRRASTRGWRGPSGPDAPMPRVRSR